jgi:hypothetical protein
MRAPRSLLLPALALVALALIGLGSPGCGEEDELEVEEGVPVELGELEYKVLFSRFLNPNDVEDEAYLLDQPPPAADELYLGVFLEIENKGDETQDLPAQLTVTDTQDTVYDSLPSSSVFALDLGGELPGNGEVPDPDSPAGEGPIEGALVLFRIRDSSTEDRPLELEIPGEDDPALVELDI